MRPPLPQLLDGPRVWVLNLDAEHELEAGARYAPTRHLAAIVARESRRLLGTLVAPGDVVLVKASRAARLERVAEALIHRVSAAAPEALHHGVSGPAPEAAITGGAERR
jgi:hypothetical protein